MDSSLPFAKGYRLIDFSRAQKSLAFGCCLLVVRSR